MSVTVSKYAGFCPGVRRADDEIKALIKKRSAGEKIFTLGSLIHNRIYVNFLKELGVIPIDISELPDILESADGKKVTVVIRTHGITLGDERTLYDLREKKPNLTICDLTCPYVKRLHKIAADTKSGSEYFIMVGEDYV